MQVSYQRLLKRFALLQLLQSLFVLKFDHFRHPIFRPLLILCVGGFHVYKETKHNHILKKVIFSNIINKET